MINFATALQADGVTGNTSGFGPEESRFEPWSACYKKPSVFVRGLFCLCNNRLRKLTLQATFENRSSFIAKYRLINYFAIFVLHLKSVVFCNI